MDKSKSSSSRVRFNSFELSDSEQHATSNLESVILELQTFFPAISLDYTDIDKLIEDSKKDDSDQDTEDDDDAFPNIPIYQQKFVMNARKDMRCIEALKSVRSVMGDLKHNIEVTNWDLLVKKGFKVQSYHSFVYTFMRIIDVNASDKISREMAFNAGRTYLALLGLPGAKRCMVWDADLIVTYFKLFNQQEQSDKKNKAISDYDDHYSEIQIIQMLNECKNVFNIVCLGDQEEVLEKYVETLSRTLEHFMKSGKHSAYEITMKCYENLEALCLKPLPDKEIESIMYLIFCRTVDLHFVAPKRQNRHMSKSQYGESISEFFLHLLSNYPEKTKKVLLKFIKSLLSNLDHKFDREKFQKLVDVAVKYELAIYLELNESLMDYLQKLALATEHRQRLNGVEFCGKMLLINSTPDPKRQRQQIDVPREAAVIKLLFEKIYDKQDAVKLKALTALKAALLNGNDYCKKIFSIIFQQKSIHDNPEIVQTLGEEAKNFQTSLLALLQTSPSTYIRKACLEILAHNCDNLLDNVIFIETITMLADDPSYLVKVQLLEIVNSLLSNNPKNKNALNLWLEVVLSLIKDNDNKIVEAAIKSIAGIFQKIESFENTVNDMQLLPWSVIRLIMAKGKRSMLQNAMNSVATNLLSQDKLRKIETHIFTSHKSEAWCILSIVAKRMKSNNPDIVVKTFLDYIDHLDDASYDTTDFHLVLEVIHNWIKSFNDTSKAQIAAKLGQVLESGSCSISLVHHLYEICCLTRTILFGNSDTAKFARKLNETSQRFIVEHIEEFASSSSSEKILCYMLLYCESNTDLPKRPDKKLLDILFDFVRKIVNDKLAVTVENDIPRKLNICIIVLTRFAVRDNELAAELTPDLAMLLRKRTMHMSVIKTSMQCLNDLCKKHTSTVAPVFKEIIYKLHSHNEEIRLCALANIYDLVMQDFIKMKGRVLLNFLACLVDRNELIQLKSQAAILSYTNDKNQNLLYTCFLESVFLFNDYIQADNFGVFPLDEIDRNYRLLYGDEKREQRYQLYDFFVQNIHDLNEVHLLLLLKQIIVLKEKFEKQKFKKHAHGVETFKDLLHIFKRICDKRSESKMNVSKGESNEYAENDDVGEIAEPSSSTQQKPNKKNKNSMTVNDALPIIEKMISVYPDFSRLVVEYDESLQKDADELTKSIAQNFSSFLEYSKPASFWSEVLNELKAPPSKRQRRSKKRANSTSSDESE